MMQRRLMCVLRVGRGKEGNGERARELRRSEKQRMDERNECDRHGREGKGSIVASAIVCELWELMKCTPGVNRESNFRLLGYYRIFHSVRSRSWRSLFLPIFSLSFSPSWFPAPLSTFPLYHALYKEWQTPHKHADDHARLKLFMPHTISLITNYP